MYIMARGVKPGSLDPRMDHVQETAGIEGAGHCPGAPFLGNKDLDLCLQHICGHGSWREVCGGQHRMQ